jgi:hypothetical protein
MKETRAAFARRLGVNKSTITRAEQAGRIVMAGRLVDVERSIERWYATKGGRADVEARHAENRGAEVSAGQADAENGTAGRKPRATTQPDGDGSATGGQGGSARTRYKAIAMQYENQQIKLEMALRRGLRYPLPAVRREAAGIGATLRAAIERIIDQTAPRLAVMTSDLDRRRLLDAELARVRWMLKRELPRALRRMRVEGGKVGAGGTAE